MSSFGVMTLNLKAHNPAGYIQPGNIASWKYIGVGEPGTAASVLSLDIRAGKGSAAGTTKVQWKLKLPTVATEANACACPGQVIDNTFVDIIFTMPDGGDPAVREDLLKRVQDLVVTTAFVNSVEQLEGVWN